MGVAELEVKTAIEDAIANGGSSSDPVVFEGTAGNVGSVTLVLPDLLAAPGTPSYEGPRYIKLQAE